MEIVGYDLKDGTSSISENEPLNNMNVYSFNKTVFISSDEDVKADVSIYNMGGQMVNSQTMEISNYKSEMDLNHLENGMYIVVVNNGVKPFSKKVFLR